MRVHESNTGAANKYAINEIYILTVILTVRTVKIKLITINTAGHNNITIIKQSNRNL